MFLRNTKDVDNFNLLEIQDANNIQKDLLKHNLYYRGYNIDIDNYTNSFGFIYYRPKDVYVLSLYDITFSPVPMNFKVIKGPDVKFYYPTFKLEEEISNMLVDSGVPKELESIIYPLSGFNGYRPILIWAEFKGTEEEFKEFIKEPIKIEKTALKIQFEISYGLDTTILRNSTDFPGLKGKWHEFITTKIKGVQLTELAFNFRELFVQPQMTKMIKNNEWPEIPDWNSVITEFPFLIRLSGDQYKPGNGYYINEHWVAMEANDKTGNYITEIYLDEGIVEGVPME